MFHTCGELNEPLQIPYSHPYHQSMTKTVVTHSIPNQTYRELTYGCMFSTIHPHI
jgi:hypothetical protein